MRNDGLARILVNLRDDAGELGPADLPSDVAAEMVMREIVDLLELPAEDELGNRIEYQLLVEGTNRRIAPGESLASAGIYNNDTLVLSSTRSANWVVGGEDTVRPSGVVLPLRPRAPRLTRSSDLGETTLAPAVPRKAQSRSKGKQLPPSLKTVPISIPNSRAQPAGNSTAYR